jgi:hypothetical protein
LRHVRSQAKTAFEPDMRIRSPSAPEPNPAKTTMWIAPMRTTASMRMMASGIVGMYTVTRSPLPIPMLRRAAATRSTSRSSCP